MLAELKAARTPGRLGTPIRIAQADQFLRASMPEGEHLRVGPIPKPSDASAQTRSIPLRWNTSDRNRTVEPYQRFVLRPNDVLPMAARCSDERVVRAALVSIEGSSHHIRIPLPDGARCGAPFTLYGPQAYDEVQPGIPREVCLLLAYEDLSGRTTSSFRFGCAVYPTEDFARQLREQQMSADTLEVFVRSAPVARQHITVTLWGPGARLSDLPAAYSDSGAYRVDLSGPDASKWPYNKYLGVPLPGLTIHTRGKAFLTENEASRIQVRQAPDGRYHACVAMEYEREDFSLMAVVVRLGGRIGGVHEFTGPLRKGLFDRGECLSFMKTGDRITDFSLVRSRP